MSKCPKCDAKIKPTYLKQTCPNCGVNMLYYKLDEQLEADAKQAEREVEAVHSFLDGIKRSTIGSPLTIIRLVVFFLPLGTMCLPMFWAGHKNVSLITFVMNIINHGFDFMSWSADYLLSMLSIVLVVMLSLVEIICSLFTFAKNSTRRNVIAFSLNFIALVVISALVIVNGGVAKAGLFVTLMLYVVKLILHLVIGKAGGKQIICCAVILALVPCSILAHTALNNSDSQYKFESHYDADVKVVSFNVASAFGTAFEDTDSMTRCQRFIDYMNTVEPDLIGTQEMNGYWIDYIGKNMQEYTIYGVERGGDSERVNSETNAILWKTDEFELIEQNTFWLSETPDVNSRYTFIDNEGHPQSAGCNRICTYALLDGEKGSVLFLNTHLDNSSEDARLFGAQVIVDRIDALMEQYGNDTAVILSGDFNEYADAEACQYIQKVLNDTTYAPAKQATYQEWGYQNTGDTPIDYIFTSGTSKEYLVLDDIHEGYVSDHYGIFSSINF